MAIGTNYTAEEPKVIVPQPDSKSLAELAIYLEGMYKGQGNLLPLGKVHLENLWIVVKYLQQKHL